MTSAPNDFYSALPGGTASFPDTYRIPSVRVKYESAKNRCPWCGVDPLYVSYHDCEWGVPVYDERVLFEFLLLESAQAGLNWRLILHKREHYRAAFDGFDPARIAQYGAADLERLLADPGLVRNRRKLTAAIHNARALLRLHERGGSLAELLWRPVGGRTRHNRWHHPHEVPAQTPASRALSEELRRLGFVFVGPVVCYALMQAVGVVNDHLCQCFRHLELQRV